MGLSSTKPDGQFYEPPYMAEWRAEVKALRARNDELRAEVERLHGSSFTLTQKLEFAQDEIERLRAVVEAARQFRQARIEMMTYGWDAHQQEAQAQQALMTALIALDGS